MENAITAINATGGGAVFRTVDSAGLARQLPREKLAWMLRTMCETRYFEEKAEELYTRGLVHGTMHLSIGMEASPMGSIGASKPDDLIIHHHRGHGHKITKGVDMAIMMGEFLGKDPGCCHLHEVDVEDIDQQAKATIDCAAHAAILMPESSPENMKEDVYAP